MASLALAHQLAHLRDRVNAYRTRAIALNAKLMTLQAMRRELGEIRILLLESSARLDLAVDELLALPDLGISSARPSRRRR